MCTQHSMIRIPSCFVYLIYMMRYEKPIIIEISSNLHTIFSRFIHFSAVKPTFICTVKTLLRTKYLRMDQVANHITLNFLKAVFHKFYLVHSWILWLTYFTNFDNICVTDWPPVFWNDLLAKTVARKCSVEKVFLKN